jgi:PTH1 family peptidyl-tRNA hydrolase
MFFTKKKVNKIDSTSGGIEFIIAGLGNPGTQYENTRHNAGYMAADLIAKEAGVKLNKLKFQSLTGVALLGGKKCLLMKPTTFMNLSGQAVTAALDYYKLPPEKLLVCCDDITGAIGQLRIRRSGSDGGHNGLKNIIYLTGSDQFPRIKIGVGDKPHPDYPLVDWVLSRFTKDEYQHLQPAVKNAAAAALLIVGGEIEKAMNLYNGKVN